ncbi:DUF2079 domain-containing protein [Streptomyces sp. NPDC003077]|uniref:DUF2079 domain-containing protein n=1 Tax=Streptomyces sp. NPDC003077 TaxID=3154443 RepID=UPI0033BF7220
MDTAAATAAGGRAAVPRPSSEPDGTPAPPTGRAGVPAPGPTSEGTSPEKTAPAPRRGAALRAPRLDPYWLALALFVLFAAVSVTRFRAMATVSWDLGIFEQAVRGYAHLQAPTADLKGPGTNILGDHFSPVLVLLAPFYRLFPSGATLLVAQSALFALSAIPVTRAAARLLGRGRGAAVGIAYGLSWGLQKAADFDFHEIAFAVPLIAFALEAVLRRRWTAAVCWAAPLVLVKEDLGVTAAAIGVVILVRARRAVPLAIGLVVFGLAAVAVTLGVIIPAFNGSGSYDYWNKLGGDGGPAPVIPVDTAIRTLLWLLLPTTGLLALRSPLLLVAVPTVGWRFVSHEDHYWGTDWHYNAVLMPVLFLALADVLPRLRAARRPWLRAYAHHLPAAALAAALALTTSLPLARLTEAATYEVPDAVPQAERLLAEIPDGATVEADIRPISRLAGRTRVLWIGDTRGIAPDYIALQTRPDRTPQQVLADAAQRHPKATYGVLGIRGEVIVLRRTSGG